jgi:DNA polymerase (family 10)
MAKLEAADVADLLVEIGRRTLLAGGNPYKAKAYARAAESLRNSPAPLADIIRRGALRQIPGVGEAIAKRIARLYETGIDPDLIRMRANLPMGVLELLSVPGLKPRQVLQLYNELDIASLRDLEVACREGRLQGAKGLGAALQSKVRQGLELLQSGRGKLHVHRAAELAAATISQLKATRPELRQVVIAGDLRRGSELVQELTLVATSRKAERTTEERLNRTRLLVAPVELVGAALVSATGSATHVSRLQALARQQRLELRYDGLRRGAKLLATASEQNVYAALGLEFIEPELREGGEEIERAKSGRLPRLVRQADLRGILHVHTDRSDGVHSLEQIAEAARERGYQYIGISDHSQSAHYAGGLSPAMIVAQHAEIDALNARYGKRFCILKGIESDILSDGSLDYPDHILARFDFVIASIHSRFRLDRERQTARLLQAVRNPYTTILGHPTGRQLLRRPGYDVDLEAVLSECGKRGVAVEINSNPYRLELDWRMQQRALELGCTLSINPDAHSIAELDLLRWGVAIARKGMVPTGRILSCFDRRVLAAYLDRRKLAKSRRSFR